MSKNQFGRTITLPADVPEVEQLQLGPDPQLTNAGRAAPDVVGCRDVDEIAFAHIVGATIECADAEVEPFDMR